SLVKWLSVLKVVGVSRGIKDDHQSNAVSHFVFRRRHRLSVVVSGSRRGGSGGHDRQILLFDVSSLASVLRAPFAGRLLENRIVYFQCRNRPSVGAPTAQPSE